MFSSYLTEGKEAGRYRPVPDPLFTGNVGSHENRAGTAVSLPAGGLCSEESPFVPEKIEDHHAGWRGSCNLFTIADKPDRPFHVTIIVVQLGFRCKIKGESEFFPF
jgi:hypothetical protein